MEIRSRKELWTLEGALPVIRRIVAIAKEHGFTVALYGSVLMKGESENDLDLYFIAAEEKTSAVHAQSSVDAVEKTLETHPESPPREGCSNQSGGFPKKNWGGCAKKS
jgi:hypothetical protein